VHKLSKFQTQPNKIIHQLVILSDYSSEEGELDELGLGTSVDNQLASFGSQNMHLLET